MSVSVDMVSEASVRPAKPSLSSERGMYFCFTCGLFAKTVSAARMTG